MTNKQIYYLITRILSLDFQPGKAEKIKNMLPGKKEDWQKWVQTGSNHLILQSLYLVMKKNHLLPRLPQDLNEYLQYIHQLNVERNKKIIFQSKQVKDLLSSENINCVFIKGTGNIFDGLYHDEGERMLYDIDILVEDKNMVKAAEMLIRCGYKTQKEFNPAAYASTMHYPILVKEDCVAGVEIHRLPVQHQYLKSFKTEDVFETKKPSSKIEGFWVMDDRKKIIHNFIHSQLMHNSHYHGEVGLRGLYDMLLLSKREDLQEVFNSFNYYGKKSRAYLHLMYKVFDLPMPSNMQKQPKTSCLSLKHELVLNMGRKQKAVWHFFVNAFKKYIAFPVRTIWDKNTRNYVFARLLKKGWFKEHINAYKRKYTGK